MFRQAPFHLVQFRHQIAFGVQPAGRVTQQEFRLALFRSLISLITKRRRVGVVLPANHLDRQSLRPNPKLLNSRRAKCVRCRQQNRVAISGEITRQLRRGSGLAGAVDTHDQDGFRFGRERPNGWGIQW